MKTFNPILWGISSLVIGLLIMLYPVGAIEILVRIIGIILLAVGAIQLITFFAVKRSAGFSWTAIPLGGVLGLIFGLMLMLSPQSFTSFFMIMVGVALIFLAVAQFSRLFKVRKVNRDLSPLLFIFPVVMMLSGSVFFFFPIGS
ncbi:MAG: DUF308 domain-containing protein, partial [Mucinivorans sp.]